MSKRRHLVTLASWETRFVKGFERCLERYDVHHVIVYYYADYAEWSEANRFETKDLCLHHGIPFVEVELKMQEPAEAWKILGETLECNISNGARVLVDIATMPRDVIWTILWLLENKRCNVDYVYHSPESYSPEWLSREPGKPRLVYKLSGLADPALRTALVILAGYDLLRVMQLVRFFEPAFCCIGIQKANRFHDSESRMGEVVASFANKHNSDTFYLDSYSEDHGMAAIHAAISGLGLGSNILLASLGPKLTAISLYKAHTMDPRLGLVYAPSHEYNREYSRGIGESFWGNLTFGE